jgi:hypothetical protein
MGRMEGMLGVRGWLCWGGERIGREEKGVGTRNRNRLRGVGEGVFSGLPCMGFGFGEDEDNDHGGEEFPALALSLVFAG